MSTHISLSEIGNTPFEKLLGHNPEILNSWNDLEITLFTRSGLDANLLEQVRRTLAFGNGCEYCMVKAGKPNFDRQDERLSLSTAFAELFAADHKSIQQAHFDLLSGVFSTKEIAALCAFISFITSSQRFGRVMNLTEDLQANKVTSLSNLK